MGSSCGAGKTVAVRRWGYRLVPSGLSLPVAALAAIPASTAIPAIPVTIPAIPVTVPAIPVTVPAIPVTPIALLAPFLGAQHRRRAVLQLVDAYGEVAEHVFVEPHLPFHLMDGGGRRIDVEQHVVALPVFLDPVGEVSETPVLALLDFSLAFFEDRREPVHEGIDGRGRDVLPRDEHGFVICQFVTPFGCSVARRCGRHGSRAGQPPGPIRARRPGKERSRDYTQKPRPGNR